MEPITKQTLVEHIEDFREKQLIEADIRKVVAEMKHHKQVNKRFTDRLTELGYHAYMIKDYSHKIRINKRVAICRTSESEPYYKYISVEIDVYGESFTWDKILQELDRCAFKQQEETYTRRLERFDQDIAGLKEVLAYLEEKEKTIEGFRFYQLKYKLESTIRYSEDS